MRHFCAPIGLSAALVLSAPFTLSPNEITSLAVGSPGRAGAPVAMTAEGGHACAARVEFGDGQTADVPAPLPRRFTHTYDRAGAYTVTATGVPPCAGRLTLPLDITNEELPGRLRGLKVSTSVVETAVTASIVVLGSGACAYTLDFGDGRHARRVEALPDLISHTYGEPRSYTIVARAEPPCEGAATGGVELRLDESPGFTRVDVRFDPAGEGRVALNLAGSGTCRVTVNWGDGAEETPELTLPVVRAHQYARSGRYAIRVKAAAPCTGEASIPLTVLRR